MANFNSNSFEKPQQWSQEFHGSFVDTSNMFRNGPDNNAEEAEAHAAHHRKGHTEKVTQYRLEQPEEEDEGFKIRTEKFNDRKSKTLSDSYLFTWGEGKGGQLAQQSEEDVLIPYVVNNPFKDMPIKACALGKRHSLFLTEKGCAPCTPRTHLAKRPSDASGAQAWSMPAAAASTASLATARWWRSKAAQSRSGTSKIYR
jgi:hypothetical protein